MADIPEIAGAETVRITDGTSILFGTTAGTVALSPNSRVISIYGGVSYTPIIKYFNFFTAQSGTIIWTPTSGKRWVITDIILSTSTSCQCELIDNNTTILKFYFADNGGAVSNFTTPLMSSSTNYPLKFTMTSATLSMTIIGYNGD